MDDRLEKFRSERKRLKAKYKSLFQDVLDILTRHDPIGIVCDDLNLDEYEPEVGTILPRLREAKPRADTRRIVHEEFASWFGADTAGSVERYDQIASDIWSRRKGA